MRFARWTVVALSIIAAVTACTVVTLFAGRGQSISYADYFLLEDLLHESDVIVRARVISQRQETIAITDPVDGSSLGTRTDVLRSYHVLEVLKGSETAGSEIGIWTSGNIKNPEAEVVLFLSQLSRQGEPIWGLAGTPGSAVLDNGSLIFQTSSRYRKAAKEQGYSLAPGSNAPFTASLDEVRRIALLPTPTMPPMQPTATPAKTVTP